MNQLGEQSSIKSIQRGTIVIADGQTTGTATIAAVDTTKSSLRQLGQTASGSSTTALLCYLTLTNSTTITATRSTGGSGVVTTASWEIMESI